MKQFYNVFLRLLTVLMFERLEMQEQLIEMQQQLIETQQELNTVRKQLAKVTPKNPRDKEVIWHIFSGKFSEEAANSADLETVQQYRDWITNTLGKKYIKPYVNSKVYMECLNQMTRGLPQRIAELQTHKDLSVPVAGNIATQNGRANLSLVRTNR